MTGWVIMGGVRIGWEGVRMGYDWNRTWHTSSRARIHSVAKAIVEVSGYHGSGTEFVNGRGRC